MHCNFCACEATISQNKYKKDHWLPIIANEKIYQFP